MQLVGKHPTYRKRRPRSNIYRSLIWLTLIVCGGLLVRGIWVTEQFTPLFLPTATPTRTFASLEKEGDTYFQIGKLDCKDPAQPDACAIAAYQKAIEVDPENAQLRAELARIQVYSSATLTTNQEKLDRLMEARETIEQGVQLNPDNSNVHAVYALVMDWLASVQVSEEVVPGEQKAAWLVEAATHASRAISLDETNLLAQAYYAEILIDQMKLDQAKQVIEQALQREDPANPIMDLHRVYGLVLETQGYYEDSIREYEKAAEVNPNLTFLYYNIGNKYRFLGSLGNSPEHKAQIEVALEYFQKMARLNEQLGINDPIPYLAIANTYANQGDFFAAVQNVRKAIRLNPTTPEVYAQLGLVYYKSRNYEGSIPAFQCALEGCDEVVSCEVRQCDPQTDPMTAIQGLPLDDTTVVYYYTYGSVLAGLHKRSNPLCDQAVVVLNKVSERYGSEPTIMSIVRDSQSICTAAGEAAAPTAVEEATAEPGAAGAAAAPEPTP